MRRLPSYCAQAQCLFFHFFLLLPCLAWADSLRDIPFKADFFQRDLQANTLRGKGNAWFKKGPRELWADEIEIDFQTKRAIASGKVHIKEGDLEVWCSHADFNLAGDDAIFDNVTLVSGQVVFTGSTAKRLDSRHFEIEDGSYSNCNIDLIRDPEVGKCDLDWKLYGSHFSVTMEEYVHVQDALIYLKGLPSLYLPYFVAPVKSQRQSGLLTPLFTYSDNLGNGVNWPYFWALSRWQDLTINPTYFSKTGMKLGLDYRYNYAPGTQGEANIFLLQRRFSLDPYNPAPDDLSRQRFLGAIGEWAIDLDNSYSFGKRTRTRQILRLVSNPYYTLDYGPDIKSGVTMPSLRSQFSLTSPSDSYLATADVDHYQSLIISKDIGIDRGSVTKLPSVSFYGANTSFWDQYLSYEFDTNLSNFYRPGAGYDSIDKNFNPLTNPTEIMHTDPNPSYHAGDYIRTGQRVQMEPRLIANIPMSPGFQLQPLLRAGTLLYHFDDPSSLFLHREYLQLEVPFSMYLWRRFDTDITGYEKLSHVFQPRFIYAANLYQSPESGPFFFRDATRGLSNPMFDLTDLLTPFQYMRFELINRVMRKTPSGSSERFMLFQLSEQYNVVTSAIDPRYQNQVGPIEILGEFQLWRFVAQVQGNYQLETVNGVRENDVSSTVSYRSPVGDSLTLGNRISINADPTLTEKTAVLAFYKTSPWFFDLTGGLEYSYKRGDLLGAQMGMIFGSKPRSCWGLTFLFGQNDLKQRFVRFQFRFDFGSPGSQIKSTGT